MKNENVILGEGCVYSTDCEETGLNNNIIVCGSSGCGKTMSVSEPRLLGTKRSSLIATVTKRRIVDKYKPLFKERGYKVCDLDFAMPERGDIGYNPLFFVKSPEDITFIASSIVKADPRKKNSYADPFWDESAISLLSAEIAYVLCENENASFSDVLKMNSDIEICQNIGRRFTKNTSDEKFRDLEKKYVKKTEQREDEDDLYDRKKERAMIRILEEIEEGGYPELDKASADEKWEFACRHAYRSENGESLFEYIIDEESFPDHDERAEEESLPEEDQRKSSLASFAVSCWNTFKGASPKTASCIYSQLGSTLDRIFSPQICHMTELKDQIDFEALAVSRTVLFVTTSPVDPSLNFFINLFYAQAIKQLFEFAERRPDGALPVPVHILCDDFATGGRILNFPEYISVFREKKISVTLLLQSESQLSSMYGANDATTIINNCDTYIYMGGMDLDTARNVSLRLDVPYDEVLRLKVGEEIVFRRGQQPVRTQRYDINSNDLYRKITSEYEDRIDSMNMSICK